jgi:hypothetical protein
MPYKAIRLDGGDTLTFSKRKTEVRWSGTDRKGAVAFWGKPMFDSAWPDVFDILSFDNGGPKLTFDGANDKIRLYPDQDDTANYCELADTVIDSAAYTSFEFFGVAWDYENGNATLRIGSNKNTKSGVSGWSSGVGTLTLSNMVIDNFRHDGIFRYPTSIEGTPNFDAWASASSQFDQYDEKITLTHDSAAIAEFFDKTYDVYRVRFVDTANSGRFIDIGRIVLGTYIEPTKNYNVDYEDIEEPESEIVLAESGAEYFDEHDNRRSFRLHFERIPESQDDQLVGIFRNVKNVKPIVVCIDPDDYPEETLYARIAEPLRRVRGILRQSTFDIAFIELM